MLYGKIMLLQVGEFYKPSLYDAPIYGFSSLHITQLQKDSQMKYGNSNLKV